MNRTNLQGRSPDGSIPAVAIAEARANPGGWVYVIDGPFGPDDFVPPEAIIGSWKVDQRGQIIDEFIPNPGYRKGSPPDHGKSSD
jgi:hypothetical protein